VTGGNDFGSFLNKFVFKKSPMSCTCHPGNSYTLWA